MSFDVQGPHSLPSLPPSHANNALSLTLFKLNIDEYLLAANTKLKLALNKV